MVFWGKDTGKVQREKKIGTRVCTSSRNDASSFRVRVSRGPHLVGARRIPFLLVGFRIVVDRCAAWCIPPA